MDRKLTQAWMWLTAGALAAAMNAVYHDGSMDRVREMTGQMAERVASCVIDRSEEVVARVTDRAAQVLATARETIGRNDEIASARAAEAMPRLEAEFERRRDEQVARVEAFTARQQAQIARFEAHRARIEADRARIEERVSRLQLPPMVEQVRMTGCPRMRIEVPRTAAPRIAAPQIRVEHSTAGPI